MASAQRLSLFAREIKERVSPAAFEALLAGAKWISEGQIQASGRYFGSTLITLDLERAQERLKERGDVATAARLAELLGSETALLARVRQLSLQEAKRIATRPLPQLATEVHVRTEGCRVLVDVEVEGAAIGLAARAGE